MSYSDLDKRVMRFAPEVHAAARADQLRSSVLLVCAEEASIVSTGIETVLGILQNNEMERVDGNPEKALSNETVDQLLGFCRISLLLLNHRLESAAENIYMEAKK